MKTDPNHPLSQDPVLEDDLNELRSQSFRRTMQAARSRRLRRQAVAFGAPLILVLGVLMFHGRERMGKQSNTNLVMHSQSSATAVAKTTMQSSRQESEFKIPRLTDSEFEELMKGYPMAIIRDGDETRYVPLN